MRNIQRVVFHFHRRVAMLTKVHLHLRHTLARMFSMAIHALVNTQCFPLGCKTQFLESRDRMPGVGTFVAGLTSLVIHLGVAHRCPIVIVHAQGCFGIVTQLLSQRALRRTVA